MPAHEALRQRILSHEQVLDLQLDRASGESAAPHEPYQGVHPAMYLRERGKATILVLEQSWLVDDRLLPPCDACQPAQGRQIARDHHPSDLTPALASRSTDHTHRPCC